MLILIDFEMCEDFWQIYMVLSVSVSEVCNMILERTHKILVGVATTTASNPSNLQASVFSPSEF